MRVSKKLITLAAALLLVGAGCSSNAPANTDGTAEKTADVAKEAPTTEKDEAKTPSTTVAIDDTWQPYVNKALNFEFKTPTKGRNAPRWEVTFVAEAEAKIKDGCMVIDGGTAKKTTVGGTEFCHSMSAVGTTATDHYATKNGSRYVVITFTKVPPTGVTDFSWDEYRDHLDQIMSTFTYAK